MAESREQRAERLARALEEAGAPSYFIANTRNGVFDNFRSTRANRHGENLVEHATKMGQPDIARRAMSGEFDAPQTG